MLEMVHLKTVNDLVSKALVYAITIGQLKIGEDLVGLSKEKRIFLSITNEEMSLLILAQAHVLIEKMVFANAKLLIDKNTMDID